jgi:hypothetical protein
MKSVLWIAIAFAAALICAFPARAELTDQEKAEVLKIVLAARKAEAGIVKLAAYIKSNPTGGDFVNKTILYGAINPAINVMFQTRTGLTHLLWVYENFANERTTREADLAKAWPQLDYAASIYRQSAARARTVPQFVSAALDFEAAANLLSSIDRTLPYAEPFPPSYPNIIGPHGDYDTSQASIAHATKYLEHFMSRTVNQLVRATYPNTALTNYNIGLMHENIARSFTLWMRVMAMKAGAVLPEDLKSATFDQAASSGLRPVPFFLALLQLELVANSSQIKVFSGRTSPPGIAALYRDLFLEWRLVLAELANTDPAYVNAELRAGGSSIFALAISWGALDLWTSRLLLFFNAISAPPIAGASN